MKKSPLDKILEHPDHEEIVSKLVLGITPKDINEWLKAKYSSVNDNKLLISETALVNFKNNYLNIYSKIKADLSKTRTALTNNSIEEIELSLQNNATYKSKMIQLATEEIDIKKMLTNMIVAIETRAAQIFDSIQEDPRNINSRNDRILREWFDTLGANLERFNKLVLGAPDQVVQHNITVQHIDAHVHVIQEAIRETLAEMDLESSLRFMEVFTEKMNKLKAPGEKDLTPEGRLVEAKIINETINNKLNEAS